ncbi:MAG: hypothetical protein ACREP7_07380 [Lysobacter sp.]
MNAEQLKIYRQDFALCVLLRNGRPMTASEVSEHIQVLGPGEGHAEEAWKGCTPPVIAGALRTLELRSAVKKGESRPNNRLGRPEPTWSPVAAYDRNTAIPFPPSETDDVDVSLAGASDYKDKTRQELIALLVAHDQMVSPLIRFLRELEEARMRALSTLAIAGLRSPE